ncbi:hypothetical protein O9929_13480 [Vibrio lentus]|nr:hypothetical protein [Vibrio lentus]
MAALGFVAFNCRQRKTVQTGEPCSLTHHHHHHVLQSAVVLDARPLFNQHLRTCEFHGVTRPGYLGRGSGGLFHPPVSVS